MKRSTLNERQQIHFHHVPAGTIVVVSSPGTSRMILLDKPGTVEVWSLPDERDSGISMKRG